MPISSIQSNMYISNQVENTVVKTDPQSNISEQSVEKIDEQTINDSKTVEKEKLTNEEVQKSIEEMNEVFNTLNQKLSFKVFDDKNDKSQDQLYVALVDKETEKVVKEIPPKEILEMRSRIKEYVGMLMDKRI